MIKAQIILLSLGTVNGLRKPAEFGIQAAVRKLIKDDSTEKCKARFIDPQKIKNVKTNEGRLKLRDPWDLHVCCRKDNCGTPMKLYSYDKDNGSCRSLMVRNICPEFSLLKQEFLNLFSTRESCVEACKNNGDKAPEFYRNKYKMSSEFETDPSGEREKPARQGISGLFRGQGMHNYMQLFREFYRPETEFQTGYAMFADVAEVSQEKSSRCLLPQDGGKARILKRASLWYFDSAANNCFMFTYKGSEGNANRFITFEECMSACFTEEAEENFVPDSARTLKSDVANYFADSKEEFCNEQPPEGLCSFNEVVPKFFFSSSTGRCHLYFSSGCTQCTKPQCNSFDTKENCKKTCIRRHKKL